MDFQAPEIPRPLSAVNIVRKSNLNLQTKLKSSVICNMFVSVQPWPGAAWTV